MVKKLLHFHIVDSYIIVCLCYFIYSIVLLLNILCSYNTQFTVTINSILLIIGTIFSVFLGPDEHLPVFECPVAL